VLLGSLRVKAARKTLTKSTPCGFLQQLCLFELSHPNNVDVKSFETNSLTLKNITKSQLSEKNIFCPDFSHTDNE